MTTEEKKELEKLTRTKLIEEAKKYEGIIGASGMKKEELIAAIGAEREKFGGAERETGKAPAASSPREKKGPAREELKAALAALKRSRQDALASGEHVQLRRIRRRYKKINRSLRRIAAAKS